MPTVGVKLSVPMNPSPSSGQVVPIKSFHREPVSTDISYPVGFMAVVGKDPATGTEGDLWYLSEFSGGLAVWRKFSATSGGVVTTISGGSGTATPSSGAITITGSGSVSTTASGSTVTISCSALTAMSFAGDTGTASGTTITLTGGTTGLTFAGATSTITLGGRLSVAQGGRMTWGVVGTSGALVPNTGIVCTTGAALTFTLPTTSAVGDVVAVVLDGSTSWSIVPGTGQTIRYGNGVITSSGSLSSTDQGDYVELVCSVGNTRWVAAPPFGNPLPV